MISHRCDVAFALRSALYCDRSNERSPTSGANANRASDQPVYLVRR